MTWERGSRGQLTTVFGDLSDESKLDVVAIEYLDSLLARCRPRKRKDFTNEYDSRGKRGCPRGYSLEVI